MSVDSYTTVNVTQAFSMINSNPALVILDVRNQSEYDAGHIRNAKLIPLYLLSGSLNELNKTNEILVYCKRGSRSTLASQLLANNSFPFIFNMFGGIDAWTNAGYPVYIKYSSIQLAINNATAGSTIRVSSGIYSEPFAINKSVSIIGENKSTTVVSEANAPSTAFNVEADNVSISDFTIETYGCSCKNISAVRIEKYHQNINVTNNIIISNGYGIKLDCAKKTLISDNNITQNYDWSIIAFNSSEILVLENNMTNNWQGLNFTACKTFEIHKNNVSDSLYHGIWLQDSTNGTVDCNTVSMNNLGYGILVNHSVNNTVFHNNFISNMVNVGNINSNNAWDNGGEGNFWSNYNGTDANKDGIGDTPYVVAGKTIDLYPLMGLFDSFNVGTWNNATQTVDVISNSTISNFILNMTQETITFNTTNTKGTSFSRMTIQDSVTNQLFNNGFAVKVDGQLTLFKNWTNTANTYIYINYAQGKHEIEITAAPTIPELSPLIILSTLMIATLVAIATFRSKKTKPKASP